MNGYIGNDNRERNERRTDTVGTNSQWMGHSYLPCDRRDRVLFRSAQRNHYPAAWEFATARGSRHTIFPSEIFSGFRNCSPEPVPPSIWNTGWLLCHTNIPIYIALFKLLFVFGVISLSLMLWQRFVGTSLSSPKVMARSRYLTKASVVGYYSSDLASLIYTISFVNPNLLHLVMWWVSIYFFF